MEGEIRDLRRAAGESVAGDPNGTWGEANLCKLLKTVAYALDGTNSYYQNSLTDRDRPRYNSWVCCPPNLSRTLLQVGRYAYGYGSGEVFVNLYVGGECRVPLSGGDVQLRVETDYSWSGAVKLTVTPRQPDRFAVNQPGPVILLHDPILEDPVGMKRDAHQFRLLQQREGRGGCRPVPARGPAAQCEQTELVIGGSADGQLGVVGFQEV